MISPWRRGDRDRRRQGAGAARDAAAVGEGREVWTAEDGIVAGGGRGQTRGREDEGPHQEEGLIEEDLGREVIRGEIGTEEGTGAEVDLEDEMVTAGTETEAEAVLEEEIGGPDLPEVTLEGGGRGLGLGRDLDLPEEEGVGRRRMMIRRESKICRARRRNRIKKGGGEGGEGDGGGDG